MRKSVRNSRQAVFFHWAGLFGIAGLVVMGTAISAFALLAFAVASAQIVFGDEDFSWQMMFFLFPFALIFKLSPGSTSLFTFVILLFVAVLFQKSRTIPALWVFLAIYLVAIPVLTMRLHTFNVMRWIKLLCSLLMVYYYFNRQEFHDDGNVFLAFACGLIASSFTYYLDSRFFRITRYIDEINMVDDAGAQFKGMVRFAGLSNDPNYYAANLIIAMCLLVILLYQKRISITLFSLLMAPLLYFNISTYSKSAMLMLVFPVGIFAYAAKKTKRKSLYAMMIGVAAAVVVFLIIGGGGALRVVLSRFGTGGESLDVNKITTGRFDRWMDYLEYFGEYPGWLIFGKGVNEVSLNGRDAHNAYIDAVYHLGLVGTALFYGLLKDIFRILPSPPKRNIMNKCILLSALTMYMFLNMLLYYDLPFHIMLMFTVLNMNLEQPNAWLHQR